MIHKIITHARPHLDEIVAIWLLRKFGEERFPGVGGASIELVGSDNEADSGKTEQELEAEGIIVLGRGEGFRFNDHPRTEFSQDCTATLVAKYLKIKDDLALNQILNYTLENDLRGKGALLDLAHLIGVFNREYPDNPTVVISWATLALEAKHKEQTRFFTVVRDEFAQNAKIFKVPFGRQIITVASIRSDLEKMAQFARSKYGASAHMAILQNSTGHVQILAAPWIHLEDLVQTIRLEEQKAKDMVVTTDWMLLRGDGTVDGAEEWYYLKNGQALLNGSHTAPNVPPTRLTLEKIEELVRQVMNPNYFPTDCPPPMACAGPKCPLYKYGWHRCRKRRWQARNMA